MSEQKKVHITICQAPYASLLERGLYLKMHNPDYTFTEPVPAEYYLTAFDGDIECPEGLPDDKKLRAEVLLEKVFTTFNTAHPAGYCGRSLSVGDVVKLEGKPFLCTVFGFQPIIFAVSKEHPTENPTACPLPLPDGTALRVTVHKDTSCPASTLIWLPPTAPKAAYALWSTIQIKRQGMSCALVYITLTRRTRPTMAATSKDMRLLSSRRKEEFCHALVWTIQS